LAGELLRKSIGGALARLRLSEIQNRQIRATRGHLPERRRDRFREK
jgi:hypothetical protein